MITGHIWLQFVEKKFTLTGDDSICIYIEYPTKKKKKEYPT